MATIVTARSPRASRAAARRYEHQERHINARLRVREADQTDDIIEQYEARQALKSLVDAVQETEIEAWLLENKPAYDAARLDIAWKTLHERLMKRADDADRDVVRLRDALIEALHSQGDGLYVLSAYGNDAINSAARAIVARTYAHHVKTLQEKKVSAEEGFNLLIAELTREAMQEARFQRHNSSSPMHNATGEAKRVQLMELLDRIPWLKSSSSIV